MSRRGPTRRGLARQDLRYSGRRRRWRALARALWLTLVAGHDSELCQECGGRYRGLLWHAPDPLWLELMPSKAGTLCPTCFARKAHEAGIRLSWVPVVTARHGEATTNHWHDETFDWLAMGLPDPGYMDGGRVNRPVTWFAARAGLEAAGFVLPPLDYYYDRVGQ